MPQNGFGLANLPYGVFSTPDRSPRVGVRYGDGVLDLAEAFGETYFATATLNELMAQGRQVWDRERARITRLLSERAPSLVPIEDVTMHLPIKVADYVDFYASEHHASNVGRIFRPDAEPLLPNWRHLPVGYHGRSSTIVVSGTDIVRPSGQTKGPQDDAPTYGPCRRLDVEVEVGYIVGVGAPMGGRVSGAEFADHVFGCVLLNDWSARDIQAWEYVPLGPHLGKSFATSISPWVVPLAALEPARTGPPARTVPLLPYLQEGEDWALRLELELELNGETVSRPPYDTMYFTGAQMLAHLTVNGAALSTGDLYGSGTVSGPEPDQRGSFLELSWGGTEPLTLADGSQRTFLQDGDTATIRGTFTGAGGELCSFGEVTGRILPAAG
ncbi:fumarylacetoacetase [Cumulibacter manganitolerans]|uniref:fumarylacetoacetase n=1 Tax=Cumulibacter manganitolerans TaxID=1884992 RepID=UPI00129546F8|nr:fumarylacetoacetase [Cumulibacter manganitolerans]